MTQVTVEIRVDPMRTRGTAVSPAVLAMPRVQPEVIAGYRFNEKTAE